LIALFTLARGTTFANAYMIHISWFFFLHALSTHIQ
jgi:hypothetical protein